jgi:ubiquinone/menaquinone biosynthesis C-methylase UbiE
MNLAEEFELIRSGFDQMTQLDIVIAPWLAMQEDERPKQRLSESQRTDLHALASELSILHGSGRMLWWESEEVPQEYREHVYYDTLLSTAAYLSHMRLGTLIITDEMISVAHRLIRDFVSVDGGSVLLSVYARVMTYLNGQVLDFYDGVPEAIFVSGAWHRPGIEHTLTGELTWALKHGLFVRKTDGEQTSIHLTDAGRALYHSCRSDLERCGYIKQREQLIRASNFTDMGDYEQLVERYTPDIHGARRSLVQWSGIHSGMKVLELGCGAGALTLDDGLYAAVGREGSIVATDPSIGMLARARYKLQSYAAANVRFVHASAERIPFPDNTFDMVTGSLFLHFTDIPAALKEIHRVLRPGGQFATLYSLDIAKEDFLIEWFEPIFRLGLKANTPSTMPSEKLVPDTAKQWFHVDECRTDIWRIDCSTVEDVVRFFVKAGTMAELNELPVEARNRLFDELVERGYQVKRKYGREGMALSQPEQWFKGIVKK